MLAMLVDTSPIRTELMVADEAYPLGFSSSSGHWKWFLNGAGDTAPVDEEGSPYL